MICQALVFIGMDQQCVIPDNAYSLHKGDCRISNPPRRIVDIFSRIIMSYSLFEHYLRHFKLLFPLRVPIKGSTAFLIRISF